MRVSGCSTASLRIISQNFFPPGPELASLLVSGALVKIQSANFKLIKTYLASIAFIFLRICRIPSRATP